MLINPLEDLAAISGAEGPDDLWRWLVGVHTLRAETNTFLGEVAFERLHRDDTEDAWRTAALLCTDPRWRKVTGKLIRAIESSGLVGEEQLGDLAVAFAIDDDYGWPVPVTWLRDGTVRIDGGAQQSPVVVVARQIQHPLRRWGGDHAVRHDRLDVVQALDAVAELPARAGDHLLLGLLDACPVMAPDTRDTVIDLGVTWTAGTVRLGALEQLMARDGVDAAARLAAADRKEQIRRWGAALGRSPRKRTGERTSRGTPGPGDPGDPDEPPAQASLFDA